ncbi:hypothetical protein FRC07_007014 [Ceratobasidium sp. 392]|nr:hypothetical protein FRC07_007014 [Ceratobasidium sp. 392]
MFLTYQPVAFFSYYSIPTISVVIAARRVLSVAARIQSWIGSNHAAALLGAASGQQTTLGESTSIGISIADTSVPHVFITTQISLRLVAKNSLGTMLAAAVPGSSEDYAAALFGVVFKKQTTCNGI